MCFCQSLPTVHGHTKHLAHIHVIMIRNPVKSATQLLNNALQEGELLWNNKGGTSFSTFLYAAFRLVCSVNGAVFYYGATIQLIPQAQSHHGRYFFLLSR